MLLSMGKKGCRYALPNAVITLTQPKGQTRGQASDIAIRAKEVRGLSEFVGLDTRLGGLFSNKSSRQRATTLPSQVLANKKVTVDLISAATGKSYAEVEKDCQRTRYFDGAGAMEYGLIDKVLESTEEVRKRRDGVYENRGSGFLVD